MSGAGPAARCDAGRAIGATGVGRTRSGGQPAAYKISLEDAAPSRGLPVAPGLTDVDGYPVIARLTIEAIGLELPLIGELSNDTLKTAPCLCAGLSLPEDAGSAVQLTDQYGEVYDYEVYSTETIAPDQIAALEVCVGARGLALIICTDGGKNRLLVKCKLSSETQ